jgi:uncharacterized membrane protein
MVASGASGPGLNRPLHPFRRAVLRGLGVVLPPLLTIVIFVWVGNTVANYLLEPMERAAEQAIVWSIKDVRNIDSTEVVEQLEVDGEPALFRRVGPVDSGEYIPKTVYDAVDPTPTMSATAVYQEYVRLRFLQRQVVIPVFLCCFVLLLYLLGKFLAAGIGKFFWGTFEQGIHRLPIIRNVYSSVKQITDFLFSEREIEYTRVVAVEYPRKGIWSLGMVTGESMLEIRDAASEPVLTLLMPTSPMPFTGFTVTVKKSETIELNITIDQAFQFIISCGVVVPPQQLAEALELQKAGAGGDVVESQEQPALEA